MIADPFLLFHIVRANAEIAAALENLSPDAPNYEEQQERLLAIQNMVEAMIQREVSR